MEHDPILLALDDVLREAIRLGDIGTVRRLNDILKNYPDDTDFILAALLSWSARLLGDTEGAAKAEELLRVRSLEWMRRAELTEESPHDGKEPTT